MDEIGDLKRTTLARRKLGSVFHSWLNQSFQNMKSSNSRLSAVNGRRFDVLYSLNAGAMQISSNALSIDDQTHGSHPTQPPEGDTTLVAME
jgi:hypothetical protein